MSPVAPLPTFLIIGAERSATRWLRFNLDRHPDIYAPRLDLAYFSNIDKMHGLRSHWYRSQFVDWEGEPILGECSPSYLAWSNRPHDVAHRISQLIPEARLIAILRDPIDRMHSAMVNHMKWGRIPADTDLYSLISSGDERALALDLLGRSIYFQSLTSFDEFFGDQLLTLFYDDVRDHPEDTYRAALDHIGASTDFIPDDLDVVRYASGDVLTPTPPTPEQRRVLSAWFRLDIQRLQEWTGRDLSAWDPDPDAAPMSLL
jgi:hypothetical protein